MTVGESASAAPHAAPRNGSGSAPGFRCPRCLCAAELAIAARDASCSRCEARFPLFDGAIPLLAGGSDEAANAYGEIFGREAESYDERFQVDPEHGRWVLRRMRELGSELWDAQGGHVLEIGAGSGHLTRALESGELWAYDELTVTDLSAEMLAANSRRAALHDHVRFWACNVRALPFEDAAVDTVFGFDILHHVLDYRAALHELARVVRPGGFVALKEPHRGAYRLYAFIARMALRLHRRSRLAKLLSPGEEALLESWGKHLDDLIAWADAGEHERLAAFDDKYFFEPTRLARDAEDAGFAGLFQLNVLYRPENTAPNAPMILDAFRGLGLGPVALTLVAEVAEDLDRTMGTDALREFPPNVVFVMPRC